MVELDDNQLHPLLAYLGYQRSGLEAVTSHDPEGLIHIQQFDVDIVENVNIIYRHRRGGEMCSIFSDTSRSS